MQFFLRENYEFGIKRLQIYIISVEHDSKMTDKIILDQS
jgi:hypothetical protein